MGEICRKMGASDATFYRWKKVYAGMGVAEIRRLKQFEANDVWAMDFMSDRLFDKRPFRILTIVDCFTREALSTAPRTTYRA